jgi:hypothetical protein
MGSFLDPMADKVLIATLFITLTYMGLIPGRLLVSFIMLHTLLCIVLYYQWWAPALLFAAVILTGGIITRDLLLIAAAFCVRYKSLPPPVSTLYSNNIAVCERENRIHVYHTLPYCREHWAGTLTWLTRLPSSPRHPSANGTQACS